MTDDQHGEGTPQQGGQGGWERLPQGDYDDGATTFVQLPEGGIDALLASNTPLAAPGHGYVPPPIAATPGTGAETDPAGTGSWPMPAEGAPWPDANQGASPDTINGFTYQPGSTGQWAFGGAPEGAAAPGQDVTGEWSIPVAGGDLPDESGEFSASALVEQWGGSPLGVLWQGRRTLSHRLGTRTPIGHVYMAGAHTTPGSGLPSVGLSAALVAQVIGPA